MRPSPVQLLLTILISSALGASMCGCQSTQPTHEQADVFVHESTDSYTSISMHGFSVLVSSAAQAHPETTQPALDLLKIKLGEVIELTPAHTHGALRNVRFWIEQHNPGFPCACYHPGAQWLNENGYNTDKVGGIEITNAEHFVEWTLRDQPMMVLHELSHAYHNIVLGDHNPQIIAAYQHAFGIARYESIEHVSGAMRRHYGLNNAQEYFAEMSESYFGRNDFYPFIQSELAGFDPTGLEMVERAWGVNKNKD